MLHKGFINNYILRIPDNVKDYGVTFDRQLTYEVQDIQNETLSYLNYLKKYVKIKVYFSYLITKKC